MFACHGKINQHDITYIILLFVAYSEIPMAVHNILVKASSIANQSENLLPQLWNKMYILGNNSCKILHLFLGNISYYQGISEEFFLYWHLNNKKKKCQRKEKRSIANEISRSPVHIPNIDEPLNGLKVKSTSYNDRILVRACHIFLVRSFLRLRLSSPRSSRTRRDRGCRFVSPILQHACTYTRLYPHTTSLVSRYTRDLRDRLVLSADSSRCGTRICSRVHVAVPTGQFHGGRRGYHPSECKLWL